MLCFFLRSLEYVFVLFEAAKMKRHDDLLLPGHKNAHPSSRLARDATVLDCAVTDSNELVDLDASGDNVSADITLGPKLDTLFADIASKLPSIDFDLSDVSYIY